MKISDRQRPPPGELFLDHVSHFVPDLDAAACILQELGFAVTPTSHQRTKEGPVGAANRCVMLHEGYIELLAPTLDTPTAQRMRASMARFVGVHLACFGTPDAEAEHRRLGAHGFAPQPIVDLRRKLEEREARFKVVRPASGEMPEGRVQFVEHLGAEAIWTRKTLAHRNGVTGLKALYVVADDVADAAARWAELAGMMPLREAGIVSLQTSRGRVHIGEARVLRHLLGEVPRAPALAGYALACRHPREFAARCKAAGLDVRRSAGGEAIALPASLGGVWLV